MLSINFLVVSYFISLFVDWVFQNQFQATNKSKWTAKDNKLKSFLALTSHSFIYAFLTTVLTLALVKFSNINIVFTTLFISHIIIDSRIPVKFIMKLKGLTNEEIYDYQNYGFMHIGIDHRLHEITLLLLSYFC